MSGWTIASLAYGFLTLGFCLGFVACAVFRPALPIPQRRASDRTTPPQPRCPPEPTP